MADPLSVAGSAVGIVSLGITVCQGLVSYIESVHGRKEEIANCLREVRNLISVFTSLNDVLPRLARHSGSDHDLVQHYLRDCEAELDSLKVLVQKLRGPPVQDNARAKIKDAGRAMVYPFRKREMAAVRQCLQNLLSHLELALDIISVGTSTLDHYAKNCALFLAGLLQFPPLYSNRMTLLVPLFCGVPGAEADGTPRLCW